MGNNTQEQAMLSRVANSLYWLNRYVERAENIARIIGANLNFMLDSDTNITEQWDPLIWITGNQNLFYEKYKEATRENVVSFLLFDTEYPSSIINCLSSARENARTVREIINIEMWEQINRFYLMIHSASENKKISIDKIIEFLEEIKLNCHIFYGIQESTLSRNESWHFGRLGKLLERADQTSRIIDVKYFYVLPSVNLVGSTFDILQWSTILKSASGFEMYKKKYKAIKPDKILEFLILDSEFPRAIKYCLNKSNASLHAIMGSDTSSFTNKPEQTLGLLRSELAYTDIQNIINTGLHEFIDSLQLKLVKVGHDIYREFFI
jgi:uncharacterized alpha-E superfamily protein